MLPKPKFCSQCGAAVETPDAEGQPRQLCPACDTLLYQNPPPMAASVVLNERREVLLVRCKRYSKTARWCLPMDFAAPGETIANAALRVLKERAGVEARLIHLLDANSSSSPEHGDLLIVTFEVEKVGGQERSGADVEKLAYFPLSRHPALAFSSSEKALRICAESHLEEWMIRDSFERLETDDTKVMLSDTLVALIRENSEQLGRQWIADVRESLTTASYAKVDPDKLFERATTALSQFSRWLSGHEADEEVADFYYAIGRERRAQGFSNHEILGALTLLKKHIWMFAHSQSVWKRPIDVYRVLELNRRIVVFFDRATYHITRGFEAEDAA
jgi:ADP-ribose pyrophosphatase YjhB (NUDIX family)